MIWSELVWSGRHVYLYGGFGSELGLNIFSTAFDKRPKRLSFAKLAVHLCLVQLDRASRCCFEAVHHTHMLCFSLHTLKPELHYLASYGEQGTVMHRHAPNVTDLQSCTHSHSILHILNCT